MRDILEDILESPCFRSFMAVFLQRGLKEERVAMLWMRSGMVLVSPDTSTLQEIQLFPSVDSLIINVK